MPLNDLIDAIVFLPDENGRAFTLTEREDMISSLATAYTNAASVRALFDGWLSRTDRPLTIEPAVKVGRN